MAAPRHATQDTEWLDTAPRRFGVRDARVLLVAVVLAVVISIVSVLAYQQRTAATPHPDPPTQPRASVPARTSTRTPTPQPPSPRSSIIETRTDGAFLEISADYEILGYGPGGVVRIIPAQGRVIETTAPPVNDVHQLSIVAGRDFVVVRSADGSAGYGAQDGRTVRRLSGMLDRASFVFPGPDPDHVWVTTTPPDKVPGLTQVTVTLVDRRGIDAGSTLPVPYQGSDYAMVPDDTGYLVGVGTGGYYLARPEGLQRITTGSLLAIGPTRFLTHDCDERARCRLHVIDRTTGARRELPGAGPGHVWSPGRISPDGRFAGLVALRSDGTQRTMVVDLITGTRRQIDDTGPLVQPQGIVWTPDSRFLLVAGQGRVLRAIDPATGSVRELSSSIPPLIVIAVRPRT